MNLKVTPDLEKIVAAAKEAQISIQEINFVRNVDTDILESLSILVDGNSDAQSYFTWLLEKSNLKAETLA